VPRLRSALAREIKQRRPFRSPEQEGTVALLRTTDLLRRHLGRVVEPHGITLQQYNVLRILRGAGEEGLPTLEIGERMVEQAPGITRLMDRLEGKALVRRVRCPNDRRQVLCYISVSGLALLERLDQEILDADRSFFAALGRRNLGVLVGLLDALRAASRRPQSRPTLPINPVPATLARPRQGEKER
jgi:DNA-binding MarR family transcriptional regulator